MKKIRTCDIETLAKIVHEHYANNDLENISVLADYEYIVALLEKLIKYDDMMLYSIDMKNPAYDQFTGYFLLDIDGDGICVEKITRYEHGYTMAEGDVLYVHKDVEDSAINSQSYDCVIIFSVDDMDEPETKPVQAEIKSSYKINGKEVSKEEYDKKLKNLRTEIDAFDEIYNDNIREMLLKHLDFKKSIFELLDSFL